jgi:hypothetical protein
MNNNLRVDGGIQSPPLCMELCFMVTSYISKKSGLADDYKILERTAQIFGDTSELAYTSTLQPSVLPCPRIELLSLDVDTINKIWQFQGGAYILSLFYKCSPIAVPSLKFTPAARVGSVDYSTTDSTEGV